MKFILTGLCFLSLAYSQNDYFTSTESLKSLLNIEEILVKTVQEYGLGNSIPHFELEYEKSHQDKQAYVGNPINSFLLLKRLVIDWKVYGSNLEHSSKVKEFFDTIMTSEDYPSNNDLTGAAQAIVRLQETYKLDPYELSKGKVGKIQTTSKLSWESCYYLSKLLLGVRDHCHCQEWIKLTLKKYLEESSVDQNTIKILEKFIIITAGINDLDSTLEITEIILKLQPDHSSAKSTKQMITELPQDIREYARVKKCNFPETLVSINTFEQYQAACRDEFNRSSAEIRNLTCTYASFKNPFLKLAPFRLEILSFDPFVALFHNVLSDREIENFHRIGVSELSRSEIGANSQQRKRSTIRTSQGTFIDYNSEQSLQSFLQKLEDMTGQIIEGADRIQFVSYGIGGHYQPHFDFFGKENEGFDNYNQGNRISTSMFYLSDVELGGSTTFPFLRINVKPQKGSMLFWLNLHNSGSLDHRTLHAGCPVLLGSKYIVNVWHRMYPQMFHRKCGLTDDSWKSDSIVI